MVAQKVAHSVGHWADTMVELTAAWLAELTVVPKVDTTVVSSAASSAVAKAAPWVVQLVEHLAGQTADAMVEHLVVQMVAP